jgi:hypothetical protein
MLGGTVLASADVSGTGVLQVWAYDQHELPGHYLYQPTIRSVRAYPADQRFEPQFPGNTFFVTEYHMAGDPLPEATKGLIAQYFEKPAVAEYLLRGPTRRMIGLVLNLPAVAGRMRRTQRCHQRGHSVLAVREHNRQLLGSTFRGPYAKAAITSAYPQ